MRSKSLLVLCCTVVFCASLARDSFSQDQTKTIPKTVQISAPDNIRLPDDYVYERRRGIDSMIGALKRKGGFEITHDIGGIAGNYAARYIKEANKDVKWTRRESVNRNEILLVYLKDGTIVAIFPDAMANFIARTTAESDIDEFLKIVMTYTPTQPSTTRGSVKN